MRTAPGVAGRKATAPATRIVAGAGWCPPLAPAPRARHADLIGSRRCGPSNEAMLRFVASFRPVMRYVKEVFRHYPMFHHRSATPAGVTGNGEVRSPGDNVTSILGSVVNARADTATASITAVGGQQSGAGSTQVKC